MNNAGCEKTAGGKISGSVPPFHACISKTAGEPRASWIQLEQALSLRAISGTCSDATLANASRR